jgi:hypothetical protein
MTHVGYLIAGWGIVGSVCAGYAVLLARRGRRLMQRVPPERARWMTSDDAARIGES